MLEPGVIKAATVKNAADDGSDATSISFALISAGPDTFILALPFLDISFLKFIPKYLNKISV